MDYNIAIKDYLNLYGITEVGFCDTKSLEGYAEFIENKHRENETNKANKAYEVYLEHSYNQTKEQRKWYDPLHSFPKGKSIVVILFPYQLERPKANSLHRQLDQGNRVVSKISRASLFEDYHRSIGRTLEGLRNFIMVNYRKESMVFCDEGPLNDKAIALKTGLLHIGRNSLLLHPHYGSRFYIGYLITELECDTTLSQTLTYETYNALWHPFCHACGKCQASCPNQAIEDFGHLSSQRCIAFLTQSKEWSIDYSNEEDGQINVQPEGMKPNLSDYVYGCDICQFVCPLNGRPLNTYAYAPLVDEYVSAQDIENLSNKQFNNIYGKTSAGWIGKKRFLRNVRWNDYVRQVKTKEQH